MRRRVVLALITAVLSLAWMLSAGLGETVAPEAAAKRHPMLGLGIAVVFPLALIGFAMSQRIDGFAFGSILLAVLLELFLFVGWAQSPQDEEDKFIVWASALPFVLIAVTVFFSAIQKES